MILAKETLKKWDGLRERGDIPKLVKLTGMSRSGLYIFFATGEYTNSTPIAKMKAFFESKERDKATAKPLSETE